MADFGAIGTSTTFRRALTAERAPASVRLLGGSGGVLTTSSGDLVIQGIVRENSAPVARKVFAFRRSDGLLVGETTSSAVDGTFTISTSFASEVFVVCLDNPDSPPEFNALIYDSVIAV